jgi:hypothetical protein
VGVTIASASIAITAAYVLFFGFIIYSLAGRSLDGKGPFRQIIATGILTARGSDADYETIWRALENSDWRIRFDDPKDSGDWRQWTISSLAYRDRSQTAKRLSKILQSRPSRILAEYAVEPLISEGEYDAFPSLIRYAVLPTHLQASYRFTGILMLDRRLSDKLTKLGVPQSIVCEMNFWRVDHQGRLVLIPHAAGNDILDPTTRVHFQSLLGILPPQSTRAAFELFWERESVASTPLNDAQRRELARFMNCVNRYWDAWRGQSLVTQTPEPDWDNAPIELLERQVNARVDEIQNLRVRPRPASNN